MGIPAWPERPDPGMTAGLAIGGIRCDAHVPDAMLRLFELPPCESVGLSRVPTKELPDLGEVRSTLNSGERLDTPLRTNQFRKSVIMSRFALK